MDLINMTNRAKIREFYNKVKWRKFLSFKPGFIFVQGSTVTDLTTFSLISNSSLTLKIFV